MDYTMLPTLLDIATFQAKSTGYKKELDCLMDYCAMYPSITMRFHVSDMILHVDTRATYLIAPGTKNCIARQHILSNLGTLCCL